MGLRITSITYENAWGYLNGFYGQLFLVEFVLFAVAPIMFYWKEVIVVIAILIIEVLVYRWIVNRMPVLRQHPDYIGEEHL